MSVRRFLLIATGLADGVIDWLSGGHAHSGRTATPLPYDFMPYSPNRK